MAAKGLPDSNDTVAASHVRNAVQKRKAAAGAKKKPKTPSLQDVYGMAANDPAAFAGPVTLKQALGAANAAANVKYGGALGTLNQQITEAPQWYQDYKNSVEGARVAAQKYQQGLIDQSNNIATQVGQTVLGSLQDQQAAESRKALANAGTNLIAGMGAANDTYFGNRAGVADASKIATMTNLLTQKRQVQGEKGAYRTSTLNDIRATATNADIARQTLGANVANQQTDNAIQAASVVQGAKDKAASRRIQVRGQNISRDNTKTRTAASETAAANRLVVQKRKDAAKKKEGIVAATGKIQVKVQDIISDWAGGASVDVKDAKGRVTGTRKANRDELRGAMDGKHGRTWVEIALKVRDHKPLTHTEIAYLHAQDPNIRIPKNWLGGQKKPKGGRVTPLAPGANGQMRPT